MNSKIREIISKHGRIAVDVSKIGDSEDLYKAGMTSLATVGVMLALEKEFDVEFPDRMLRRQIFESVTSMHQALEELLKEKESGAA